MGLELNEEFTECSSIIGSEFDENITIPANIDTGGKYEKESYDKCKRKDRKEINEAMDQLELFKLAQDLNMSDDTRSDFTKVTTYVSGIQQTLSYIKQGLRIVKSEPPCIFRGHRDK